MAPTAPRRVPASQRLALIAHDRADSIAACRNGRPVTAATLIADIRRTAESLPERRHVLNFCSDRYRFAVLLCAAIIRRQISLLPPTTTPNVIESMRQFAPDAYFVSDDPDAQIDLPRFELPTGDATPGAEFAIPRIDGDQVVACIFTSGTTGEPQPNFKAWGKLVISAQGEAARFRVGPGHTVLGTVPPQHMYGFESTVLLPLLSGAILTAERLYYPAEIDAVIGRTPGPRTLFITPFHLRAWLESGANASIESLVSATAPLSVALARVAEERTGATLHEIYGCTEAGQIATRRTTESRVWRAYEGLRLQTDGDETTVCGGHVDRPTRLMDVIEVLGDGSRFLLHGRTADLVNIAGKRNSISYLTHQLSAIPGVLDGAFYLPDDAAHSEVGRLMAFVVAPGLTVPQVTAMLRKRIDAAFMPRPLVLVERLPRQATGKLSREALRALAGEALRQ
jgi:acyl-coenzyme A synthetase/AMP-(fatty) acid ligase